MNHRIRSSLIVKLSVNEGIDDSQGDAIEKHPFKIHSKSISIRQTEKVII